MYDSLPLEAPLSQGDILDDCPIATLEVDPAQAEAATKPTGWRFRVVVLTQACDIAQTKTTRILVAVVHTAADLVSQGVLRAALIRDQVRRGLVYGWYFLPTAPAPIALPESIVDLRDLHTTSKPLLERLIADGKRICRIQNSLARASCPALRRHLLTDRVA